ncbi:MAG: phospholipid carrier-dependent glycosyltransferase [Mycobacteriaceae bacterium]|nr:phospholipid carrier-dependent glycosyltransferase [Mycobacteriaceae bacterium]
MTAPTSEPTVAAEERRTASRSGWVSPGPLAPIADFGPADQLRGWAATAVVTALAAVTRFLNLSSPTDAGTPIFDEKHYAPQAWQLLHNHGVEDNPGYGLVVHPPVGKQLIALGEAIFGYTGLGWRFTGALLGVLLVALVVRIVRRISRSTLVGGIAGLLLIGDGVSFVAARTALLDGFLTFFVVAAFGALIVDRDDVRHRMHIALLEGHSSQTEWGPRLGVRWWRFGAGVLLGLACATKWSGLYFVVFFGMMSLAFDVTARRQYQVRRPWLGVARRDLAPTAYALLIIPFVVYLASYAAWFASETAIDRHEAGQAIGVRGVIPLPDALRSLWYYTYRAYQFHSGLTNSAGNYHPWESKPWAWPMSLRPVLYAIDQQNVAGCGTQSCVKAVMLVGTPALWWLSVPVGIYAGWRTAVRHDWRYAAVLTGYCAGWLPWFADIDRQMYFFYAAPMAPFLVMAIALILGDIVYQPDQPMKTRERHTLGLIAISSYAALVLTNFAWLFPILTGVPISPTIWDMQIWLPSWR